MATVSVPPSTGAADALPEVTSRADVQPVKATATAVVVAAIRAIARRERVRS